MKITASFLQRGWPRLGIPRVHIPTTPTSMTRLYAVGGRQKLDAHEKSEWHAYGEAVILSVDLESGSIEECIRYVSPGEACPDDDPSMVFKAGTLANDRLYVCSQTEVLVYNVPSFERVSYLSHPWFNDVHHVRPGPNGSYLVANTGLDMVMELDASKTVLREWSTVPTDTWDRFSREVDYRKVPTTKPHEAHPNQVFLIRDDIWATRGNSHDAICLTQQLDPICLGPKVARSRTGQWPIIVHDGIVRNGRVYFTGVDGRLIVVDAGTRKVLKEYDLNRMFGGRTPLGWCRGIELLDDERIIVGFSRIRPTRWRGNVQWMKHLFGGRGFGLRPTRLMVVNIARREIEWERNLEPHLNTVFSIHLAP